jgi:hypothetical protein
VLQAPSLPVIMLNGCGLATRPPDPSRPRLDPQVDLSNPTRGFSGPIGVYCLVWLSAHSSGFFDMQKTSWTASKVLITRFKEEVGRRSGGSGGRAERVATLYGPTTQCPAQMLTSESITWRSDI